MPSLLSRLFGKKPTAEHLTFTVYTRKECSAATRRSTFQGYQKPYRFQIVTVDVDEDPELVAKYNTEVPVVALDGKVRFRGVVTRASGTAAHRRGRQGGGIGPAWHPRLISDQHHGSSTLGGMGSVLGTHVRQAMASTARVRDEPVPPDANREMAFPVVQAQNATGLLSRRRTATNWPACISGWLATTRSEVADRLRPLGELLVGSSIVRFGHGVEHGQDRGAWVFQIAWYSASVWNFDGSSTLVVSGVYASAKPSAARDEPGLTRLAIWFSATIRWPSCHAMWFMPGTAERAAPDR